MKVKATAVKGLTVNPQRMHRQGNAVVKTTTISGKKKALPKRKYK